MGKLKIEIDALQVESFEVDSTSPLLRGTVKGNAPPPDQQHTGETSGEGGGGSTYFSCTTPYATNENTCQGSCYGTCGYTCHPDPDVYCI